MKETKTPGVLSAIQSSFLPWFGYFSMMQASSHFVVLDNLQFDKNSWRNRNRINRNGEYQWITVPVHLVNGLGTKLNEVEIDYSQKWITKILGSIENNYKKCPHYPYFSEMLESAIRRKPVTLHELNLELIQRIALELELSTKIVTSSEIETNSDPNQRLIELTQHFNCGTYLSGQAAREYLNIEKFKDNTIEVLWYEFDEMFQYKHQSSNFLPKLSIIDLLMNLGSFQTKRFLSEVNRTKETL
jgi:hypothetical protein